MINKFWNSTSALFKLITGLPGLLALFIVEEGETQVVVFSLLKETLLAVFEVKRFSFF